MIKGQQTDDAKLIKCKEKQFFFNFLKTKQFITKNKLKKKKPILSCF